MFCLSLLLINQSIISANAIPIGAILKGLKGGSKILKGGSKVIKPGSKIFGPGAGDDILKRIDDIKINKSGNPEELISNTILKKSSTKEDILNAHGIRRIEKVVDGKDVVEYAVDGSSGDGSSSSSVSPFHIVLWIGRVFRVSKNYNKPEIEDRIIIKCKTDVETFIFTALLSKEFQTSLDKKQKNWFLLSQHLPTTVTKLGSYTPQMSEQELMVLKDLDDYLIFSNKISSNKKYPTKYFIISENAKFVYEFHVYGTESPDYIINNAQTKILESPYGCKRIIN
jgi:hypothetical protein